MTATARLLSVALVLGVPIGLQARTPITATEAVVYAFQGVPDGRQPSGALVDIGGTFYGVTSSGGATNNGTVFSLTPGGTETAIYSFLGGTDGQGPGGLINVGGTLYGTTYGGGVHDFGTVYSITPAGAETVLYSFSGGASDGRGPGGLVNIGGTLYGTTTFGGPANAGTVFSFTPGGSESVVYSFTGGNDGISPNSLIAVGGTVYGLAAGGANGLGVVFSVTTGGVDSVLHSFTGGTDGSHPSSLINVGGTLYGATALGGNTSCVRHLGCGTVFSLTPGGTETVLFAFAGGKAGYNPGTLTNIGRTLYGTTGNGGSHACVGGCGTVFKTSIAGAERLLYSFKGGSDSSDPFSLIDVGGTLYGTSATGGGTGCGGLGCGTVFSVIP